MEYLALKKTGIIRVPKTREKPEQEIILGKDFFSRKKLGLHWE